MKIAAAVLSFMLLVTFATPAFAVETLTPRSSETLTPTNSTGSRSQAGGVQNLTPVNSPQASDPQKSPSGVNNGRFNVYNVPGVQTGVQFGGSVVSTSMSIASGLVSAGRQAVHTVTKHVGNFVQNLLGYTSEARPVGTPVSGKGDAAGSKTGDLGGFGGGDKSGGFGGSSGGSKGGGDFGGDFGGVKKPSSVSDGKEEEDTKKAGN